MGFIALDVRDCGLRGKTDEEIFEYAQREKAIISPLIEGLEVRCYFPWELILELLLLISQ